MKFKHSGAYGDIVYALPTIIALGGGHIYFKKAHQIKYMLRLLNAQPYIRSVGVYQGEADINLDAYRDDPDVGVKHLCASHMAPFGVTYDLSKPWLTSIEPNHIADIIVQRTKRYRNTNIDYSLLKPYESRCAYAGTKAEHEAFQNQSGLKLKFLDDIDALGVAEIIKGSKLFVGNQSVALALAEGMKHPRAIEFSTALNNCQPNSNNGYTHLTPGLIKFHLSNKNKTLIPAVIPDEDIKASPILQAMFNGSRQPTFFFPNYGEFGPTIDKLIKIVHFYDAPYKIVACRKGEEALFPSADEFFYDWTDFVEDYAKWGFFCRKNRHTYKQMYVKESTRIVDWLGEGINQVHLWPFSKDSVYNKYTDLFRFPLRPRTLKHLKVDVVISPRFRDSRPENNFEGWQEVTSRLNAAGHTVGCIGRKEVSLDVSNSSLNSWDFEDYTSAAIEMLQNCKVHLGLETGTAHLASFLNTPMIIFSHANPKLYSIEFMQNMSINYCQDLGKHVTDHAVIAQSAIDFIGQYQ